MIESTRFVLSLKFDTDRDNSAKDSLADEQRVNLMHTSWYEI